MGFLTVSTLCSELDLTAQNLYCSVGGGGHPGVSGGCQVNLGMNGFPATKEERKARSLIPQRESGPGEKDIQHSTPLDRISASEEALAMFSYFLLVLKRGSNSPS